MAVEAFLVRPLYPGYIAGGLVAGSSLAPVFVSAKITNGGDAVSITYDAIVEFGAGGNGGFTVTPSGGAATLAYSSGAGTRILIYSTSRTIGPAETMTLDYTNPGDGVQSVATGDDAANLSGETVSQPGSGGMIFAINNFSLR